jgi:hypothetical protein
MAVCLILLLGAGESFKGYLLVPVQRLFLASESIPLSEETADTEPEASYSSVYRRPAHRHAPLPVPRRVKPGTRDSGTVLCSAVSCLPPHLPNLPCGISLPIRC